MRIELEPSGIPDFRVDADRRPRLEDPLQVKLVAVNDVWLTMPAGLETRMDAFYVRLLGFQRDPEEGVVYRTDNFRLRMQVVERPDTREHYRHLGVEVLNLAELEHRLIDAEVEYTKMKGLLPGSESLVLQDPAGNWLEVVEAVPLM